MRNAFRGAAVLAMVLWAALGAAADAPAPRVTLDISNHPFAGPANAPVTIVDFADYL